MKVSNVFVADIVVINSIESKHNLCKTSYYKTAVIRRKKFQPNKFVDLETGEKYAFNRGKVGDKVVLWFAMSPSMNCMDNPEKTNMSKKQLLKVLSPVTTKRTANVLEYIRN